MLKRFTSYSFATLLTIILLQAYSCKEEIVPKAFHPRSDHEAYLHSLEEASLLEAALGRDWQQMAEQCLEHPVQINTPHQESFYFQETEAEANAYRFDARRGQKIQVNVDRENAGTMRLFIDLFRISTDDHTHVLTHIASSDQMKHRLAFEPRYDAMYILRIQPELLRGGRLHLSIVNVPSLEFPVENGDNQDIGSFFGDPRDGGRRKHHGIDIFAKRHTPILAPTDGYIRFAGERGLGGQVVWMRDRKRDMTLYFAHLQTIIVEDDTYVKMGDTLGTVGNTGNARTTPPHLHFGIYQHGPIDPYHFVAHTRTRPETIRADLYLLGEKVRAKTMTTLEGIRTGSDDGLVALDRFQLLEIESAYADRYRVKLPNGAVGSIGMNAVEPITEPLHLAYLPDRFTLVDQPTDQHTIIEETVAEKVTVLAKDTAHWYVRSDSGYLGWVQVVP